MSHPQTSFANVTFDAIGFLGKKRTRISSTALLYQLKVLKDTGRYDAFRLKWHPIYDDEPEIWPVPKHLFWDSDVAKWIEGACYFLQEQENHAVRSAVDDLVDMIMRAQQPDGYLNIHFTVVQPEMRFKDLRDLHELYNAGHLIEGALAHERLTGSDRMLHSILLYVNLLAKTFGRGRDQKHGYPGHPEIELALLRLYERTQDQKHLDLAEFFITERGNAKGVGEEHYYDYEAKARGEGAHEVPDYYPERRSYWYQQAHRPLVEQDTLEGHSVRAMYLLTALADLVRIKGKDADQAHMDTLYRLWKNMVDKKMYLTGGIGAIKQWEGFGSDYFLPQSTDEGGCYAETCASIGVMMLADRLLQIQPDGAIADILELELYNAVLTGVSCNGKEWTYVNQLASSNSDLSQRSDWFTVACCPPNVLRLLGNLGGYLYSIMHQGKRQLDLAVHLYTQASIVQNINEDRVEISMNTQWPLDGKVEFTVHAPKDVALTLRLRVPGWARKTMTMSTGSAKSKVQDGYLILDPGFTAAHSTFTVDFPMQPRLVRQHPFTGRDIVAVARGPVVYCAEDFDNPWVEDHFKCSRLLADPALLSEELVHDDVTGEDYVKITASKAITQLDVSKFRAGAPTFDVEQSTISMDASHGHAERQSRDLILVPYYFRANRGGRGHMRVGFMSNFK